ncbi:MAG: Xaa-Pro dipeptidyl-peptidase [Planctomycetota bacterium]
MLTRFFGTLTRLAICWTAVVLTQNHLIMPVVSQEAVQEKSQEDSDSPKQVASNKTLPVFVDGEAQIVEGFKNSRDWIRHDLWVETDFDSDSNGDYDRMHVSVVRPQQTDTEGLKVPVVYVTSPYFAGMGSTGKSFMWDPKHELNQKPPKRNIPPEIPFQGMDVRNQRINNGQSAIRSLGPQARSWVPRGFAVVHSCSPGTGLSEGCPTVGGDNESLAPKAVIDWLCGRRKGFTSLEGDEEVKAFWSTGKVGMTGVSYNGTLPLAAATTGVDGLEAIIPIAPNTSYYHYYRSNGLVRHPGGYMGEDIDVLYDFIHSGDPESREHCNCEVRDKEMANNQDRISGDYNEFWAGRDYTNKLDSLKAATLMVHGFNDWNVMPSHSIRIYEALKKKGVPCQIYLHQGAHTGVPVTQQINRWFTRYLYGVENGVENDPKARIVRGRDKIGAPTPYADYPNPEAQPVKLYLSKGGSTRGELKLSPLTQQGQETLIDDVSIRGSSLAKAESSENRLLYVTPKLKRPLHLSGKSTISLSISSSKPACNLSVWMVSLPWERSPRTNANLITRGWADPQNHKSLTESEPLEPGKFYDFSFDLEPDDQIIPVGQQIGLMIFSSDREFTLWPEKGTELTIDLDKTSIEIPVVGGEPTFKAATSDKVAAENAVSKDDTK